MNDRIDDQMEVAIKCTYCKEMYTIYAIKVNDYQRWVNGEGFIEDLMPYLESWEREMLISATCDKCWQRMFRDNEDNEEDLGIDYEETMD